MSQPPIPLSKEIRVLAFIIMIYVITYTLIAAKFLFLTWSGDMGFIKMIISNYDNSMLDGKLPLAVCTILGAVLGGSILSITSLHRYSAITKTLDFDHIWGYLMTPILSGVIGTICFCLLLSGIFVLTGSAETNSSTTVIVGYTIFGTICGYNWDVFIKKLENLAKKISDDSTVR